MTQQQQQQQPQQAQQPQLRSNIPKSIFTHSSTPLSNDTTWLMTPLSPPLGKLESNFASHGPPVPPVPQLTTSTPPPISNRRPSSMNSTWHSLWTSSTWQPNNNNIDVQTSPIDLEFLDSPLPDEQQKVFPTSTKYGRHTAATATALDDYFQLNRGEGVVLNQSQIISSPTTRRPYQHSSGFTPKSDEYFNHPVRERSASIWTFDWNPPAATAIPSREEERRHSIAAFSRPLTPPPQPQQQQQQQKIQQLIQQVQQQQKIDEYFSPTTTMIDVQALGKGTSLNQLGEKQLIYQVQFKVKHRSDFFYVLNDNEEEFKLDDMVVVEADRGYDLGKIVAIIESKEQRKKKKLMSGDTVIKRIFRHANPSELITYEQKKQDEQKALVICQVKIKQKDLNMEVVDAEYQWDRRKLTFYFKANERIDFRELVRELFKIYKTRIWMCASSPATNES